MTRSLSEQFRRTLRDRADSFSSHVERMLIESAGASEAFKDALGLVQVYTQCLKEHIELRLEGTRNEFDRQLLAKQGLMDLKRKEAEIDRIFARSGQSSIPRSLARRVAEEFRSLQLPENLRPVLSIGGPGKFETYEADWRGFLFHDLWASQYPERDEYKKGQIAVITVPYLEGARALWEPLVLGHEVGHIAIFYRGHQDVPGDRAKRNPYLTSLASRWGLETDSEMTLNWVKELLCDLNMCRIYGPSAVAALADMLTVTDDPFDDHSSSLTTHPPRSLRLKFVYGAVGLVPDADVVSPVLKPWRDLASEPPLESPAVEVLMMQCLEHADEFWQEVLTWGEGQVYEYAARTREVEWLSSRMLKGIPGGIDSEAPFQPVHPPRLLPQDIVNAAWAARDGDGQHAENLTDSDIDRLALKALDSLEFVDLWKRNGGTVEPLTYDEPEIRLPECFGQLSSTDIRRRLTTADEDARLTVTPLLGNSIGDAGIDVRLASSFIVFKHSATSVFDATRERDQDPRIMQETVEKEWGERFILHPDELVLAATLEYIVLPRDLTGQLITRSSYGRLGLLIATAIQVQPGSPGVVTLELHNVSRTPLALRAGQRIGQLILHQLSSQVINTEPSSKTYRYRTGPEFSKVTTDWDNEIIRKIRNELTGRTPAALRRFQSPPPK